MDGLGEKQGRVRHTALPAITQRADDRQDPPMLHVPQHAPSTRGSGVLRRHARRTTRRSQGPSVGAAPHKTGEREHGLFN